MKHSGSSGDSGTGNTFSSTSCQRQDIVTRALSVLLLGDGKEEENRGRALSQLSLLGKEEAKDAILAVVISLGDESTSVRDTAYRVLWGWYPHLKDIRDWCSGLLAERCVAAHLSVVHAVLERLPDADKARVERRPGWQALRLL